VVLLVSTADSVADSTVLVLLALVLVDSVAELVLDADVALVVAFVALVLEFVACSQVADAAQTVAVLLPIAVAQLLQLQIADADVTKPNWLS